MFTSLPSRGAWIEIMKHTTSCRANAVAPLAGSVDRNSMGGGKSHGGGGVAPLAGSVDRNAPKIMFNGKFGGVAPLAGSVDRNAAIAGGLATAAGGRSPRGERG